MLFFCLISKLFTLGNIIFNYALRRWILITSGEQKNVEYLLVKASAFFIFSLNDNPSKTLFTSYKKLFSLSRYLNFCISVLTSFFPCQPLKINLKVYGIINCLNKNLITHFVWYLEKVKRCDIETLSIDRVLNKEHFMEISCRKRAPKASSRPLFNFGK